MITVSINNEIQTINRDFRLSDLLESLQKGSKFAVAVNGEFVPRSSYQSTELKDKDAIDIVSPVGGG